MLKPGIGKDTAAILLPAAFRRLCVETVPPLLDEGGAIGQPPLGGCVLKQPVCTAMMVFNLPAAFRRLCVETAIRPSAVTDRLPSRL